MQRLAAVNRHIRMGICHRFVLRSCNGYYILQDRPQHLIDSVGDAAKYLYLYRQDGRYLFCAVLYLFCVSSRPLASLYFLLNRVRPRVHHWSPASLPTAHEFTTTLGWATRVGGQAETGPGLYKLGGPLLCLCALP